MPTDEATSPTPVPAAEGCLVCAATSDETPLLALEYRGGVVRICAQHLPVLIHDPAQLADRLPGAESLTPASHGD